jgi:hypothetical protein
MLKRLASTTAPPAEPYPAGNSNHVLPDRAAEPKLSPVMAQYSAINAQNPICG